MRVHGLLAVFLGCVSGLWGCGSSLPTASDEGFIAPEWSPTAVVAGQGRGEDFHLDQALITTHNRVLGLALFNHASNPDLIDLDPGAWFLGIRFRYDSPGPVASFMVVDYDTPVVGTAARGRLYQGGPDGTRIPVAIAEGFLHLSDWTQKNNLITTMTGTITLKLADGSQLKGTFSAPLQGWYLAP